MQAPLPSDTQDPLHGVRSLHFIGIGGIGVSAVARIALGRGFRVSGSDVRQSQLTDAMQALGATVHIGHHAQHVHGVDVVVISTAIPSHNVELQEAITQNLRRMHRSEVLAALLSRSTSIGVTGTHGKGTTAAMIARCLDAAGEDPGFIIGGLLLDYGVNARSGGGRWMVAEVDESDGSHHNVPTDIVVCNYLDADHLNYYKDHDEIIQSMAAAIRDNPRQPRVFVQGDCPGNQRMIRLLERPVTTYGTGPDNDYVVDVDPARQRPLVFSVRHGKEVLGPFELPLPGRYNAVNAAGAVAVVHALGLPVSAIHEGLAGFHGLENRFAVVDAGGITVVKDYNSHPTAIRKVLDSAKDFVPGRLISVFKPYRYTLTHYLRDEYATAFDGSHTVLITTMYAANEDPIPGVDTAFVVDMLRSRGLEVVHLVDAEQIVPWLTQHTRVGDGVLFFGGDDFFRMADGWVTARSQAAP